MNEPRFRTTLTRLSSCVTCLVALSACDTPTATPRVTEPAVPDQALAVSPAALSQPPEMGGATAPALWAAPGQPGGALLLAAEGEGGLSVYTMDGKRLAHDGNVEAVMVSVLPHSANNDGNAVAMVYDARRASILAIGLSPEAPYLTPLQAEPLPVEDELTGLCSHRSLLSGGDYLYGVTDEGLVLHWELYRENGDMAGRLLRSIPLGKGAGFCAVDPSTGDLFVSDEELGLWRLGAEPEADTTRAVVDLVTPWGGLGEEIKGIAVAAFDADSGVLLVADAGAGQIAAYALPDGQAVGHFSVEGLSEAEGLAALVLPEGGWIAVADEDESDGATEFKLLAWSAVAGPMGLAAGVSGPVVPKPVAVVQPALETEPVESWGDAADDPAIWVHPDDPTLSLVIGTQKQMGLHVYDLDGRSLQFLPDGRINNVDLRDGFELGGEQVSLVVASNRTHDSLSVYRVDAAARRLVEVADGTLPTGLPDPYGLCLYHSAASGELYAFVNGSGDGLTRQFRLYESRPGKVGAELVREIPVGGQAEGCAADDDTGQLYVAQEDYGLWRYGAEPDADNERRLIDSIDSGRLTADVEGVSIWAGPGGSGYLVVSNQGEDNYALYRREGDNAFIGKFHVVADPAAGIDGASETDGLEVTSAALGERFPDGLLVVQDGRNLAPSARQNFKYVSWTDVMAALQDSAE